MAIKRGDEYLCSFCKQGGFTKAIDADIHMHDHDLIYIPFTAGELNQLVHFIYFNVNVHPHDNIGNISPEMVKRLQSYLSKAAKKQALGEE